MGFGATSELVHQLALVSKIDSKRRKEGQGVVCSEDVSLRTILRVKAGIEKFPRARSNDACRLVGKATGIIYMLGVVLEILSHPVSHPHPPAPAELRQRQGAPRSDSLGSDPFRRWRTRVCACVCHSQTHTSRLSMSRAERNRQAKGAGKGRNARKRTCTRARESERASARERERERERQREREKGGGWSAGTARERAHVAAPRNVAYYCIISRNRNTSKLELLAYARTCCIIEYT